MTTYGIVQFYNYCCQKLTEMTSRKLLDIILNRPIYFTGAFVIFEYKIYY